MTAITPIRITTVLGTLAVLAAVLATTAAAAPPVRLPDTRDAAAQSGGLDPAIAAAIAAHRTPVTAADRRSPDTKDAATQSGELDPALGAAIAAHGTSVTADGPALAAAIAGHRTSVTAADKRSPDTKDATDVQEAPTTTPQISGGANDSVFDWTDAAIGAVAGFAIALLLGGMFLVSTRGRHGSLAL